MLDLARGLVAAGGLERVAGAGAVDEDALLPDRGARLREARVDVGIASHVDLAEDTADLARERFALVGVQVEDRDLDAVRGERAHGCRAEARSAAGDDGGDVRIEFHGPFPFALCVAVTVFR